MPLKNEMKKMDKSCFLYCELEHAHKWFLLIIVWFWAEKEKERVTEKECEREREGERESSFPKLTSEAPKDSRREIFIEKMFAFLCMNYQLLSSGVLINKVCDFLHLNKIKSLEEE